MLLSHHQGIARTSEAAEGTVVVGGRARLHLKPQPLEAARAGSLTPCGLYLNGRAPRLRSGYLTVPSGADCYLPRARYTIVSISNGGLCRHCSGRGGGREQRRSAGGRADLPLDRRLLFIAELTGQNWWVVSVTLRRWSFRTAALQAARDLYATNNP
jgi:hypothetical protein